MNKGEAKISKIRKQPRRTARKQLRPYFKNPLKVDQFYLPSNIQESVASLQYICLRNLDQLVPLQKKSDAQLLSQMRRAVNEQQSRTNQINLQQTAVRRQSISLAHESNHQNYQNIQAFLLPDPVKQNQGFFLDIDHFLRNDI